jgi:hypothetical protein
LIFVEGAERTEIRQRYLFGDDFYVFKFITEDNQDLIVAAAEITWEKDGMQRWTFGGGK